MRTKIWNVDAAARYDTPGTGMLAPRVLGPMVDRLAELAGRGRALEFAIGTGPVAVPLAERGISVAGIELSVPMIEQLRTKVGEEMIPVTVGDMATAGAPGDYPLVYLANHTISNLLTQKEQVSCFRNAARRLSPSGRLVIELWVPELPKLPPGQGAVVGNSEPGSVGLDTYDVLRQSVVSPQPNSRRSPGRRPLSTASHPRPDGRSRNSDHRGGTDNPAAGATRRSRHSVRA